MTTLPQTADLFWVPLVGVGIVVVLFVLGLIDLWNRSLHTTKKVARTASMLMWTLLFVTGEAALAFFAYQDAIVASASLFILSSSSVALGAVLVLAAKMNKTFPPRKEDVSFSTILRALVRWCIALLAIGAVTFVCFICLELPSNSSYLSIDAVYLNCEVAVIAGIVGGCWFIFQRKPLGFTIPLIASFVYGMAEYFVETFKAAAIMPGDLRNASTGMSVAGGYEYELTATLLICLIMLAIALGAVSHVRDPLINCLAQKKPSTTEEERTIKDDLAQQQAKEDRVTALIKKVVVFLLSILIGVMIAYLPLKQALATDWEEEGIEFDYWQTHNSFDEFGIIPSFIYALQLEQLEAPAGYTSEKAEALQTALESLYDQTVDLAPKRQAAVDQFNQIKPHIILVMNESFADLSYLGGLGVNYEGPDYLTHMNAIAKGKTSVSVYGGGTCNSEFESLSSTSLGYVSGGINPYALYDLSHIDSVPRQLGALGYTTTAIHPENPTNWGRDQVYPAIGFDQFISQDAFADANMSRGHVTDRATYEKVLDQLKSSDTPQFVFDLTMQGHGGYDTGMIPQENDLGYDFSGIVDPNASSVTDEYLSSVNLSDQDLRYFITELEKLDEPVVLVFFGDHHPGFSWWYKDRFADDSSEAAFQESMYQTDYLIWANYDIAGSDWTPESNESNTVIYTGSMAPASLMSWTFNFIGAPLSAYQKADYVSRWWVQSNNLYGFMDAADVWHAESEVETIGANVDIYEQGLGIINEALDAAELPRAEATRALTESTPTNSTANGTAEKQQAIPPEGSRAYQDAVMANIMRWLAYLNFSAKLT